jgi:alpha-glucosidase (family GH31 glycosyl hydrolase)
MWGPDIYVVPITEKGQQVAKIDFPDAHPWFNLFNDERVVPNPSISVARCFWGTRMRMVWNEPTLDSLTMNQIPVFVKAGAFIPMAKKGIQSTEAYSRNEVEVHFYYDPSVSSSTGKWYEDDGISSQNFDGSCYTLYEFSYSKKGRKRSLINVQSTSLFCKPLNTSVTLVIHNVDRMPRIRCRKNDKSLGVATENSYDKSTRTVRLTYKLFTDNKLKIKYP